MEHDVEDAEAYTFDIRLTGCNGGPCPACNKSGKLTRCHGDGAYRWLEHLDEQGMRHFCVVPEDMGTVQTSRSGWYFKDASEEPMTTPGEMN